MTTKLEQQTLAVSALCSHAFVPDSVAVLFRVHTVLVGVSLQCSSLVMLVLVGSCLLAWRALWAGGRQHKPSEEKANSKRVPRVLGASCNYRSMLVDTQHRGHSVKLNCCEN